MSMLSFFQHDQTSNEFIIIQIYAYAEVLFLLETFVYLKEQ